MKYWASEPIDGLLIKVKVMICILIIDLQIETCIIGIFLLNGSVKSMIELCLVWP